MVSCLISPTTLFIYSTDKLVCDIGQLVGRCLLCCVLPVSCFPTQNWRMDLQLEHMLGRFQNPSLLCLSQLLFWLDCSKYCWLRYK